MTTFASVARRRRRRWLRWPRARSCDVERGADGSARRRAAAPQRLRVGGAEPLRPHAVDDDRLEPRADRLGQPPLELERLVDRHLLGQRDGHVAGALGVGEPVADLERLAADRADARDLAERARRGQHRQAVAGGRRVDDHEVVRAVALVPALRAGPSSQTLAIVISSLAPGAAATKYWNADERASTFSPSAADLLAEPLLERRCGSIVIAHRLSASCDLGLRRRRPRAGTRARRDPARRPRRRSSAGPRGRPPAPSAAATVVFPTPPLPVT